VLPHATVMPTPLLNLPLAQSAHPVKPLPVAYAPAAQVAQTALVDVL
jgi:hypothetical protein